MVETFDEWSKFTTWNRERKVGTNLGTRILCADSQIHREDSRCRAIEATKKGTKWRNKFRSGPKLETRIPLLGHYCPEYSPPPSPHSTTRGVLLRFNFPRFASVPKIFLSFLRYSFFFFFLSQKRNGHIFYSQILQLFIVSVMLI